MIGRVARAPEGGVRVYVTIAYSRDYGTCGLTAHDGDSERVAVDLRVEEGGALVTRAFYTAAHEGTLADHSRLWSDAALAELTFEEPAPGEARWVVYPSADKHATYGTIEACESISPLPCVDEDCAPNNVSYPERYDLLPPVHNAGEDTARLLCASPVREKLLSDPF